MAEAALHEVAQLVDDRPVPVRAEHVDERLRRDDLADRRGERRRPRLLAHALDLVEHLVEASAGTAGAQLRVDRRDEPDRHLAPRRPDGDAWQERRHRHVADVLVDEVGGLPEHLEVDAGVVPEPGQRLRRRLGRDAVAGERDRVDRAGDQVGAGPCGLERDESAFRPAPWE